MAAILISVNNIKYLKTWLAINEESIYGLTAVVGVTTSLPRALLSQCTSDWRQPCRLLRTKNHHFAIDPFPWFSAEAYVNTGTSRDTSEFSCDSICHWCTYGIIYYSLVTSILLLMDDGGSNSSRHYIFKQDLQALADEIGIKIRIAHYPPYTPK